MKTEKAHQIANPEILKVLKVMVKGKEFSFKKGVSFCVLKGILIAQEKELNFLNEISRWHEEFSVAYIKMVDERREALKISNEDLRRVLK